jgi:monoamine oxidase
VVGDPALVALMDELGVKTGERVPHAKLARVVYAGGVRRTYPVGQDPQPVRAYSAQETKLGFLGRIQSYFAAAAHIDEQMWRSMEWSSELARLDRLTCADHMRNQGASAAAIADIADMMPIGEGVESISALEVARSLAAIDHERKIPLPANSNGRIVGGSDALTTALAQKLGDVIACETELVHLDRRAGSSVGLVVRDRNGQHRLEAARVVLTLPFSVLKTITVTPSWSSLKARAIAELGMTSVTRVWVASDRRYWLEQGESGSAESDLPTGRVRDETEMQAGTAGVLGIYATAATSRRLAQLDASGRIAELASDVERVHPSVAGHIVHGDSVAWDREPFARGAYAAFRPGQLTELAPAAAAPEGAIHFAGCGTSFRPGFMHGAIASAHRVIDEILVSAQGRPTKHIG